MNGIVTLSQGEPLRFTTSQNTSFSLGGAQTPDTTGKSASLGSQQTIYRWFDTSQFSQPANFQFGALSRNTAQLRNSSAQNLDFSLFKRFRVKERVTAELRGEAFNLTNHPLFSAPGTTFGTPTFGVVTAQENSPRQLQLGLKVLF